jgi:hypothetical protein
MGCAGSVPHRGGPWLLAVTFRSDLSRTTKYTTIKTSDDNSPAHVTVKGRSDNNTIQIISIPQIKNSQTTPVAFCLGIEEISPYSPSKSAASQRTHLFASKTSPNAPATSTTEKNYPNKEYHKYLNQGICNPHLGTLRTDRQENLMRMSTHLRV